MKTIGLLGGMTWHSTLTYYKIINEVVNGQLGGQHSAKCLLYSVDFAEIENRQRSGQWAECAAMLTSAAQALERAGADCLLICTNTMHKVAAEVQAGIGIPLLHIADITADALLKQGITKTALLGTRYTMQEDFYTGHLQKRGIEVLLPTPTQMAEVHRIILEELAMGQGLPKSKAYYVNVVAQLQSQGAQAAILGCTEIGMLLQQADTPLQLVDTTQIHAVEGALFSLA